MKASLLNRLDSLGERFEELSALLSDAEVISDQTRFRAYSKEYAELEGTVKCYEQWRRVQGDIEEAISPQLISQTMATAAIQLCGHQVGQHHGTHILTVGWRQRQSQPLR